MKNNDFVNLIYDKIFWGLISILPLLCFVLLLWQDNTMTIAHTFNLIGLGIVNDNLILTTLESIFGSAGVFPIFATSDFLIFATYYGCIMLIHFVVDCLVFLVRWAHNLLDKVVK